MILKNKSYMLGAHMSGSGGLENALYDGAAIGCNCIQLFTHSNRQWGVKPLLDSEISAFLQARTETGITEIATHASYLINLGSPRQPVYEQSLRLCSQELLRCEALHIPYLIIHPGSALTGSREDSIQQIAVSLQQIIKEVNPHYTQILLENMAGQGSTIGKTLEELATIRNAIDDAYRKHIGFCIDTCHAFASGYAINTNAGYTDFWHHCDEILGRNTIKIIHLNDSMTECGSHVDRHQGIGKGSIGLGFFKKIMHDQTLATIPKILETPYTRIEDHIENLTILRTISE